MYSKFGSLNVLQIVAKETGPVKLSVSADVIVNVIDINDNIPVFSKEEYRWEIIEKVTTLVNPNSSGLLLEKIYHQAQKSYR